MYQILRIGKYDPIPGNVITTVSSVLSAIRKREDREQHDIVYNYRNYVVNKDYSYEICKYYNIIHMKNVKNITKII